MYKALSIPDSYYNTPTIFNDNRGLFSEFFSNSARESNFRNYYSQNISISVSGTLRGLHMQISPYSQGKYVSCISGQIIDFFIDLRRDSETFLKHEVVQLDSSNLGSVYIPAGCLHGFYAVSDATVLYGVSNRYSAEHSIKINPVPFYEENILPMIPYAYRKELIISTEDKNAESLHSYCRTIGVKL